MKRNLTLRPITLDRYTNGRTLLNLIRRFDFFVGLFEVQVLTEAWPIDDNIHRPHSAHGWPTPVEFVERWVRRRQLQLA